LQTTFAITIGEFTIVDFREFDGVICARFFVGYAVKAKFDDFDKWL
jgi:hypothetical protein